MFALWVVDVAALVAEQGAFAEGQETVGEAWGDIENPVIVCREAEALPLTKTWGTRADVHGDIVDLTFQNRDQLALGVGGLVVQAAQDATPRPGDVVLDEFDLDAGCGEAALAVGLFEETALVAKDLGLDQHQVGDGCGFKIQAWAPKLIRY